MTMGAQTAAPSAPVKKAGPQFLIPFPLQIALVNLKEKKGFNNDTKAYEPDPKGVYSVVFLVPKWNPDGTESEQIKFFQHKLCEYMGVQGILQIPIHPFVNGMRPSEWNDGDSPSQAEYQGFAGHWYCKATTGFDEIKTKYLGTVVEMDGTPCPVRHAEPDEIYSGCFVEAVISCAEYQRSGQVKFYLGGLKKVAKGEMWAGTNQSASLLGLAEKTSILQSTAPISAPAAEYIPPAGPPVMQQNAQPQYTAPTAAPQTYAGSPIAAPQTVYQAPAHIAPQPGQPFNPAGSFAPPAPQQMANPNYVPPAPQQMANPNYVPPAPQGMPAMVHPGAPAEFAPTVPMGMPAGPAPLLNPQLPNGAAQPSQLMGMLNRPAGK